MEAEHWNIPIAILFVFVLLQLATRPLALSRSLTLSFSPPLFRSCGFVACVILSLQRQHFLCTVKAFLWESKQLLRLCRPVAVQLSQCVSLSSRLIHDDAKRKQQQKKWAKAEKAKQNAGWDRVQFHVGCHISLPFFISIALLIRFN